MADQQELNLEEMPLADLKAAALAEEERQTAAASVADLEVPPEEAEKEEEPEQYVYKKEIDLGDGSGVQVFTGVGETQIEALENLNENLVEAQRNATKKIHEMNNRIKEGEKKTEQQNADEDFVIKQRLEKEPNRAIRDVVAEVLAEREASAMRQEHAKQIFVDTHPDYIADRDNATRLVAEVQRLGYNEFTDTSLEKAYQSLKASGLLKLKVEEAGGVAEAETTEQERIVPPVAETTQPRSPKRASTVSTRSTATVVPKAGPSEDELYSMPLDKLKQLSNEQLAKAGAE